MSSAPGSRAAVIGVVPAAGRAHRLQPLDGSKELIPVQGRPVVEHLLERLEAASPDDIRLVTRPDKEDLVVYATSRGLTVIPADPRTVAESLRAGIEGLSAADIVLFGFPDTLWGPVDGFARLRAAVERGAELVLGVFRGREPERSDAVVLDESGSRVTSIHVKASRPPSRLVWGCLAARARALTGIPVEMEPGRYFDRIARAEGIEAVAFGSDFVDIGTPEALAAAGGSS